MGKTYHRASAEDRDFLDDQLGKYHEDLQELDIRIGMRMVRASRDESGAITAPAIMHAGHRCFATIKLVKAKERVFCDMDAIIDIDMDEWENMDDAMKAALVDHELCHVEIKRDKEGNVATDDDTRPILKLRPDAWYFTGFPEVLRRHGSASLEYQAIESIKRLGDQLLFDWMVDVDNLGGQKRTRSEKEELEPAGV